MKHINLSSIEKAIAKIDNLDEDALEKISETYALAQPVLLGYVMSAAEEYENENLEGLIIYYFCIICEAFAQEGVMLNVIEESHIDEYEEPFFDALDTFFEEDSNFEVLEEFTGQETLMKFMATEVSTPDEDGTELDDETATQLFIVTSSMIGLMSNQIK